MRPPTPCSTIALKRAPPRSKQGIVSPDPIVRFNRPKKKKVRTNSTQLKYCLSIVQLVSPFKGESYKNDTKSSRTSIYLLLDHEETTTTMRSKRKVLILATHKFCQSGVNRMKIICKCLVWGLRRCITLSLCGSSSRLCPPSRVQRWTPSPLAVVQDAKQTLQPWSRSFRPNSTQRRSQFHMHR